MIKFEHVSKTYDGKAALDDVSVEINDGEFVFIVGPSGAGKSTFIKLITKEIEPDSGSIFIDDKDITKFSQRMIPGLRRNIGMVFQDFRLLPNKTVYENVAFAMQIVGTPARKIRRRVPAILNTVNLSDKHNSFPEEISGGEQQRVALARALANNPKVIVADEPTGNIDPEMSLEIMNLLLKINKLGKTVIVVTHEKELVDYYQQRVIMIKDGVIAEDRVGGMYE